MMSVSVIARCPQGEVDCSSHIDNKNDNKKWYKKDREQEVKTDSK